MSANQQTGLVGKASLWTGRVISTLIGLFFIMGSVMNLAKVKVAVEGTTKLGFSESTVVPLGITVLIIGILYLIPQTAVLGAILITGYLGGAVATHVRIGDPPLMVVYPAIFGAVAWLGLWLRDRRVRALVPWRS